MDYDKLIHCLKCCARVDAHNIGCDDCGLEYCGPECQQLCGTAATALSTLQAENEKLRAELEKVKRERYVAIEYLREIEWCAGCKHFGGLDGCKKWAMGQCTEKHDLYEFVGPQKED